MKTKWHIVVGSVLCLLALVLAILGLGLPKPKGQPQKSLRLGIDRIDPKFRALPAARGRTAFQPSSIRVFTPGTPTFAHPVISGIGGTGFEEDIRLDPTNPNRIYTSVPGTLSADTSWIWHSLDGGKTFKWIVNAAPLEGKVTTCNGGGDTELGVDSAGHLYFNDLTLANFSTGRSDDFGATFVCSNTGVPDTAVDRQWYAIDGDPTNGGILFLTNDEIGPGGAMCGGSTGNNVLVMYRSPLGGVGATAGIEFGPAYKVTADLSCDEAIMGNNELSPIATTLGQPNGMGGYTTLPTPVKHVYVVHDNAQLNTIRIGRCFPVAFGAPVANVSDPTGLNCTDLLVADLGPNAKTGGNFPTMAIDNAGNLYSVWEQAPINAGGQVVGDTVLKYSYSTDQGNTWSAPLQIDTSGSPVGTLHTNVFAWMAAGDDGRVAIAWYGTPGAPTFPSSGPDSCGANCDWSLWVVQTVNGHAATAAFTAPIQASGHFVHRGSIQTLIGGQSGDRTLGDFLQVRMGAQGELQISYADSNNVDEAFGPHAMFVRQNGGTGLLTARSPVNIQGLAPFNSVSDPTGDGKYEVSGVSNANMPQLDIIGSSITKVTTAPCSVVAPCYEVVMRLSNLSLAPTTVQDPDPDLVWSTQWLVPSATDPNGGKNFHVYGESLNGGALQCFAGENAVTVVGGGVSLTYPGATTLPAANCRSTLGPNGTITIDVPISIVGGGTGAIDRDLHEVTASTMTLTQPANSVPSFGGIGGSLFNLIDVAQSYVFDPLLVKAVSRKVHGATPFDVNLPLSGAPGIECRMGQGVGANEHQVIVSFASPVTVSSAAITQGTGSVSGTSVAANDVIINLTGVTNAQTIGITLFGVNDGTTATNVIIPMGVLLGDTSANGSVNSSDVSQTKAQSGFALTPLNFRTDVTVNGAINSSDVSSVKTQSGTALP
ncbi:MAG TPA: hypothetical protein VFQ78_02640 [Candidatus Udaeobacter sp.]|nr:hypothetical protein [Candidatus Udaeobacter sp.]